MDRRLVEEPSTFERSPEITASDPVATVTSLLEHRLRLGARVMRLGELSKCTAALSTPLPPTQVSNQRVSLAITTELPERCNLPCTARQLAMVTTPTKGVDSLVESSLLQENQTEIMAGRRVAIIAGSRASRLAPTLCDLTRTAPVGRRGPAGRCHHASTTHEEERADHE